MRGLLIILACTFTMPVVKAQVYMTNRGHAEVHGDATAGSYTGVTNELKGTVDLNSKDVSFEVRLESIDTDNSKRNGHMYEALNTKSFPYATFHGKLISSYDPESVTAQMVTVSGVFTIHGVTRPVQVTGVLTMTDGELKLNASFPVYITHYGIERPKILFFKVEDKHTIEVNTLLYEQAGTVKN